MAVWLDPVVDRKISDCVYGNPKGCLSAEFLNRMENNVEFIKQYLDARHIVYATLSTETDKWSRELYLKVAELNRIEQNVINIRATGITMPTTPYVTESQAEYYIDFVQLNIMEQVLLDVKILLDGMTICERKLGTFTLGNNSLLQLIRR